MVDTDGSFENSTDDDGYTFSQAGLMVIEIADGSRHVYSPQAWRYVEAPAPKPAPRRM